MVKLTRIYTKTGDNGTTGLVDGSRVSKDDMRIQAIGDVDELNALIGQARTLLSHLYLDAMLGRIQNDLFDLGADLATPIDDAANQEKALRILPIQVTRLETELDKLNDDLSPLKSFILPGGNPPAAAIHVARSCARRAERKAVALSQKEEISQSALQYLNRVSDFLFVAARWCNDQGQTDTLWEPGQNQ